MSDTIGTFFRSIHGMSTSGFFVLCTIPVVLIVLFMRLGFKMDQAKDTRNRRDETV